MSEGPDRGFVFWFLELIALGCVLVAVEERWAHGEIRSGLYWLAGGLGAGLVGFNWGRVQNLQLKRARKGRMGLLNLRVDVPKAMAAQNKRLFEIAELAGRLGAVLNAGAKVNPTSDRQRIALANKTAAAIKPVAKRFRREADGFLTETVRFSTGLDRWLEIAEGDQTNDGFSEQQQVPVLIKMLSSGKDVLPTLKEKRQMFERLRGASDTMDASCGEVVEAFDVVIGATEQVVATSERSLRRIKAILERFVATKLPTVDAERGNGLAPQQGQPIRPNILLANKLSDLRGRGLHLIRNEFESNPRDLQMYIQREKAWRADVEEAMTKGGCTKPEIGKVMDITNSEIGRAAAGANYGPEGNWLIGLMEMRLRRLAEVIAAYS